MTDYAYSVAEVTAKCLTCGAEHSAIVAESDFERYCAGALVQEAFPEATVEAREVVIGWRSGAFICPACWGAMDED
jgi:hypothetical protein